MFEELILESLVAGVVTGAFKERLVVRVVFAHLFHLLVVIRPSKAAQSFKMIDARKQALANLRGTAFRNGGTAFRDHPCLARYQKS